jgi:hypothetical protein
MLSGIAMCLSYAPAPYCYSGCIERTIFYLEDDFTMMCEVLSEPDCATCSQGGGCLVTTIPSETTCYVHSISVYIDYYEFATPICPAPGGGFWEQAEDPEEYTGTGSRSLRKCYPES